MPPLSRLQLSDWHKSDLKTRKTRPWNKQLQMHRKLFHLATSELHWSMENAMETIQITTPRQMAVVPRIRAAKKWPSWPNTSSRSRISTFSPSLVSTHHKPIERGVKRSRNHPSKPPTSNTLTRLHRALATMDRLKAIVTKRGVKIHVIPTLDLYSRYNGKNSVHLWVRSTCIRIALAKRHSVHPSDD